MTQPLPPNPCLNNLKKQAKGILNAHKTNDTACLGVLRNLRQFSGKTDDEVFAAAVTLQETQFALAMEYGYESWPALKKAVDGSNKAERMLLDVLTELIDHPADRTIFSSLLGETAPRRVAGELNAFTMRTFGEQIETCLMSHINVGLLFGLTLTNGEKILLRVHHRDNTPGRLSAFCNMQTHLYNSGFPCPKILVTPTPLANTHATVEEYCETGVKADARQPAIRNAMAEYLYKIITSLRSFNLTSDLPSWGLPVTVNNLWPPPHTAMFNFEKTSEGAEWIDDIARKARGVVEHLAQAPQMIGPGDWSIRNFRFNNTSPVTIFDCTGLIQGHEVLFLANAAISHTYKDDDPKGRLPTPDECIAFIRDYETARGKPFTETEKHQISAAATYVVCYIARCGHSYSPGRWDQYDNRAALQAMTGDFYFEC